MIEPFSELTHAQEALGVGDKRTARDILMNLVRRDPSNIEAWLLLSQAMEEIKHRRDCVHQVLQLDPDNQAARAALAELDYLEANPPPPRRSRSAAKPTAAQNPPESNQAPVTAQQGGSPPAAAPTSVWKSIAYGLAGGLLLGMILVALIWWMTKPQAPAISPAAPGGLVFGPGSPDAIAAPRQIDDIQWPQAAPARADD